MNGYLMGITVFFFLLNVDKAVKLDFLLDLLCTYYLYTVHVLDFYQFS